MKFPVFKAFSATIAYLAQHAIDLLKALWLPALLLVALQFYAFSPLFGGFIELLELGENPEPAAAASALGAIGKGTLVLIAGSAIAFPMMTVASLAHLVRGDRRTLPFYLQYGGDELRVLAGFALLSLMILLISLVGALAGAVLSFIIALLAPGARSASDGLGELIANLAIFWFRLRLCVLFPAAIASRTIGFGLAWNATRDRVLGLLAFWILIGVIVAIVAALAMGPFLGGLFPHFEKIGEAAADQTAIRTAMIPLMQELSKLFSLSNPSFPFFAGALYLSTIVTTAIVNVAAGTAWRCLTDRGAPAANAGETRLAA